MIKRSENHEKYCKGAKPHFFISECQAGFIFTFSSGWSRLSGKTKKRIWDARDRMDDAWGTALSKRINP
jgi:hypothetical protein